MSRRCTSPHSEQARGGHTASRAVGTHLAVQAREGFIKALRDAHRWLDELLYDPTQTIELLAVREGKIERSIRMTLSLAFVSSVLAEAAMEGRLPRGFCVKRLTDLPMLWSEQWRAIGLQTPTQARKEINVDSVAEAYLALLAERGIEYLFAMPGPISRRSSRPLRKRPPARRGRVHGKSREISRAGLNPRRAGFPALPASSDRAPRNRPQLPSSSPPVDQRHRAAVDELPEANSSRNATTRRIERDAWIFVKSDGREQLARPMRGRFVAHSAR